MAGLRHKADNGLTKMISQFAITVINLSDKLFPLVSPVIATTSFIEHFFCIIKLITMRMIHGQSHKILIDSVCINEHTIIQNEICSIKSMTKWSRNTIQIWTVFTQDLANITFFKTLWTALPYQQWINSELMYYWIIKVFMLSNQFHL